MLQFWIGLEDNLPIRRTASDTRTFSLHVLSGSGFGKPYSFQKSGEPPKPGHMFNYRDSLALILENSLLILIFGPKFLTKKFLPRSWLRIGQATVDFKYYITEMVNDEKLAISQGKIRGANITNSLIRASEEMSQSAGKTGDKDLQVIRGLTEGEIYGNIFVYNFAGHNTTALTLNSTLHLLAAYPKVQDWISEEINNVVKDDHISTWNYNDIYPQLNRCLAVLLETVRLWNPLIGIAKCTSASQQLMVDGKDLTIPPNTRVIPNINAVHAHPRYWGSDGLVWRPDRWILSKSGPGTSLEREYLRTPPKGAYVPWSEGARACPGKKFAQVEFVAAIVSLFRSHRVEVVPENGDSKAEAQKRSLKAVQDSRIVLLLQMNNPESIGLRWVEV
ncbi:putative cytochrome P450 4d21, partial [Lachnellula suecica]